MLQQAAEHIRTSVPSGPEVLTIPADVAQRDSAEAAVHTAIERFGSPSHLILSAGAVTPGYFHELPVNVFEQLCAVNYFGTLYMVKAAYPAMQAAHSGRIGLIASAAALTGVFGYSAYTPSKYAVRGFAECLRSEARRDGITVTVAYPPDTDTPQLAEENLHKPVETKAITGGRVRSAAYVARRIWEGLEKGRFSVTPGLDITLLATFHSVLAPMLRVAFDRIADRAARRG